MDRALNRGAADCVEYVGRQSGGVAYEKEHGIDPRWCLHAAVQMCDEGIDVAWHGGEEQADGNAGCLL